MMNMNINDPRICISLLMTWGIIFSGIIYSLGDGNLMFEYGPSEDRTFMSIKIDNWTVWSSIACLIMMDKFINSLAVDIIGSWISHTIYDHKNQVIPYTKTTCQIISCLYSFYFNLRYIITLKLIISQVDYGLLRVLSDVVATYYSTYLNIKNKKTKY